MDTGIPVSKGQLTTSAFAGALIALAQTDPENTIIYGYLIAGLCLLYRVTDIVIRIYASKSSEEVGAKT